MIRPYFILGTLSTFGFSSMLVTITSFEEAMLTNVVSLIGGVLSALIIARLKEKWRSEH